MYCPTSIGLPASVFVAAPLNSPFPTVQLASWKLGPSGPVPLLRYAHPSLYSHPSPVPSVLTSPNVSITTPSRKSSIASSPLMFIAFIEIPVGAKPKNSSNLSASELTYMKAPALREPAPRTSSTPALPPPLLALPRP